MCKRTAGKSLHLFQTSVWLGNNFANLAQYDILRNCQHTVSVAVNTEFVMGELAGDGCTAGFIQSVVTFSSKNIAIRLKWHK